MTHDQAIDAGGRTTPPTSPVAVGAAATQPAAATAGPTLFTIGHGTAEQDELLGRLRGAKIAVVVDVRIAPGSRRHPHVSRDALAEWLPAAGIGYRWERRLGGFRKAAPDSPDVAMRNESFRGYAGHMRTPEFLAAIDELLGDTTARPTAVMCSETVWWRCHRRLIADFVSLARDRAVRHVMPGGRLEPHRVTAGARLVEGLVVYDDVAAATR
ncbi:MAG TPA: DUF488 domain-containing protein [Mycobacteriales bacterium]|nr:DUF488 domain-containing protein [Mycobacteriales bacterium]